MSEKWFTGLIPQISAILKVLGLKVLVKEEAKEEKIEPAYLEP